MGGSGCQVASRGKSRFRRRSLVIFVYDVYVRRLWADAHSAFPAASLTSSRAFLKRCHSLQPASTPSFVATLIERERGLLISQTTSSQHRCSSLPFVASSFFERMKEIPREKERERGGELFRVCCRGCFVLLLMKSWNRAGMIEVEFCSIRARSSKSERKTKCSYKHYSS